MNLMFYVAADRNIKKRSFSTNISSNKLVKVSRFRLIFVTQTFIIQLI